jgi:hypothetical protein
MMGRGEDIRRHIDSQRQKINVAMEENFNDDRESSHKHRQAAWFSIAASHRNIDDIAARNNEYLRKQRQPDGLWPWEPFYNQKEHWAYGHKTITSLFAFEALQLAEEK